MVLKKLSSWRLVGLAATWTGMLFSRSAAGKPMALDADEKVQLLAVLNRALAPATNHLAWFLGVRNTDERYNYFPDLFKRYKLDAGQSGSRWLGDCLTLGDDSGTGDSPEYCAVRKLQALDAVCASPRSVVKAHRAGIRAALRSLEPLQQVVAGLGLRRDPLPGKEGVAEGFVMERGSDGQTHLSPLLHSVAVVCIKRCTQALSIKQDSGEVKLWVEAAHTAINMAAKVKFSVLAFHELSVVWEALAYLTAQFKPASALASRAKLSRDIVEKYARQQFFKHTNYWSYSGAAAVALRLNAPDLQKGESNNLRKFGNKYMSGFSDRVAPGINFTQLCTCGPVSGLAPLATALQSTKLASMVIDMILKDIELFQVPAGGTSGKGTEQGLLDGAPDVLQMHGAFVRSSEQLALEKRARTVRIDDTLTCVVAINAAIQMVQRMPGITKAEAAEQTRASKQAAGEL